jgi:hypothetical protein
VLFPLDLGKDSRAALRLLFPDKDRAEQAVPAVQVLPVLLWIGLAGG